MNSKSRKRNKSSRVSYNIANKNSSALQVFVAARDSAQVFFVDRKYLFIHYGLIQHKRAK